MALQIDGKTYRNLQEQVGKNKQDIQDLIKEGLTLGNLNVLGIHVIGKIDSAADLPETAEAFGDAYIVGTAEPYSYYVWSDFNPSQWVNIGQIKGPQGEQGPKGDTGVGIEKCYINEDYLYIVYTNNSTPINLGEVIGAQGPKGDKGDTGAQGPQGIQGPQGQQGPQGAKGVSGFAITILGALDSASLLPDPTAVDRHDGYLVTVDGDQYLYGLIGTDDLSWYNMGRVAFAADYVTDAELATALQTVNNSINEVDVKTQTNTTNINGITATISEIQTNISTINTTLDEKQDTLVSGTNIKTINNTSVLGSGNIHVTGEPDNYIKTLTYQNNIIKVTDQSDQVTNITIPEEPTINYPVTDVQYNGVSALDGTVAKINVDLSSKQDIINTNNKLSADYIETTADKEFISNSEKTTYNNKQDKLVSGTNIRTINGTSLLASGNIQIDSGPTEYLKSVNYQNNILNITDQSNNNTRVTIPTVDYPITDIKVDGTSVVTNKVGNIDLTTKQDKLTSAQLEAVNSGITATKVAQIDTNTNNIDSLEAIVNTNTDSITALQSTVNTNTTNINTLTTQLGGYTISVVTELPETPDLTTIYFVKE